MAQNLYNNNWLRLVAILVVVAITVTVARTDEAVPPAERAAKVSPRPTGPPASMTLDSVEIEVPETTEVATLEQPAPVVPKKRGYWIGVKCTPAGEALLTHLGLPKGRGLLVVEVVEDSPADKAKLRRHDLLLKLGKTELAGVDDLMRAIATSKGEKLTVSLIRRAKPLSTSMTPIRRPEKFSVISREHLAKIDADRQRELVSRFLKDGGPNKHADDFRMRFYGPGVVVSRSRPQKDFQGNLNISISRTKDGGKQIVLTKDGKVHKFAGGEFQKLPADIQEALRKALGTERTAGARFDFKVEGSTFSPSGRGYLIHTEHGNALLIPLGEIGEGAGGWFGAEVPAAEHRGAKQRTDAEKRHLDRIRRELQMLKAEIQTLKTKSQTAKK